MTKENQKPEKKVNDDEVMITSSISDLEKMLEGVENNTNTKFERYFLPALAVFSAIVLGMFSIIYSITQDMERLADAMDPNMGGNMSSMVESVDQLTQSVGKMTHTVEKMEKSFAKVNKNMDVIALKLDNLDPISADLTRVSAKMDALEPMLINMEEMNKNMTVMQDSMSWMQRDLTILRASFAKPMSIINKMPVPF